MADNEKQTHEEKEPKQPNVQTDELEKEELERASGGGNYNCGCGLGIE